MVLQIDFFAGEVPGEGTKYVVRKHTAVLVKNIMKDIGDFSLKKNLMEKSLSQLYSLIVCAENKIKPHCADILKNCIYKLILDEEPEIAERTYKIAELLGLYVQTDFLLPMMISHLTDSESKNVPRYVSSCLTAFSAVIHHSTQKYPDQLDTFMNKLINLIVSSDFLNSENPDVLDRVLLVTQNLVDAAGPLCKNYQHGLFKILLQLGSIPVMQNHVKRVDAAIEILARNCNVETSSDLFSIELSVLLDEMKESYE